MPAVRKDTTPVTTESPDYLGRVAKLGDFTVAFETLRSGKDPAANFQDFPDGRCPCPHWGIVVKGRWTARYGDHEETFEAGDVLYTPPGHLPLAEPGTELITFSPTEGIEQVNAVLAKAMARNQGLKP
jgi:hypothetical protein